MPNINVENLRVNIGRNEILREIDFSLDGNICVAIVGESGSGKTMLVRSLMGLLPTGAKADGSYQIDGNDFSLDSKEREWRRIRGSALGMVMQDPFTALDPLKKCGQQILEGVPKELRGGFDVSAALAEVGLPFCAANQYPLELSGGMRQRVVIAAALVTSPGLLIADEATTALDVITQREILDLLDAIRVSRDMPLILITHNIRLARERADRIIVMEHGRVVESGLTEEVISCPRESATKLLIEADARLRSGEYPEREGGNVVLRTRGLCKQFGEFTALDDINLEIRAGEIVGIVGQSGSGKTTLARCIVGLSAPDGGCVERYGKSHPQIVFQDSYSSLNPSHTVRQVLEESLVASGRPKDELGELLECCELSEEFLDRRPALLSGGQRQRVAIARALSTHTDLLVCDESVSALDLVVQNQILSTLVRLNRERGLTIIFITHDLSVVRILASRIYVMNGARIVESGTTKYIFEHTQDDYTNRLIEASGFVRSTMICFGADNQDKPASTLPFARQTHR